MIIMIIVLVLTLILIIIIVFILTFAVADTFRYLLIRLNLLKFIDYHLSGDIGSCEILIVVCKKWMLF